MTLASTILAGRAAAERQMLDTCTVRAVTGRTSAGAGKVVPTYGPDLYGPNVAAQPGKRPGMCKVQARASQERTPEAGGATFTVQRLEVHVPVASFVPAVGQVITLDAAALDPYLVGRDYRVTALLHKTAATAYRLVVEEVS